jgi:hypothetical protein
VIDLGRSVGEAKWLPNVDMGIEEGIINVQLAELEVHGGGNSEKRSQASHSDDMRECLCVVKSCALAASLNNKRCFVTGDIPIKVGVDLIDQDVVYACTTFREVNEFPRAVGQEGVILILHGHLPFSILITRESGTVRGRLDAISCGEEGNSSANRLVRRGCNCESQLGLFDDVLSCNTLLWVTTRSDVDQWVGRKLSNIFTKPDRV